MSNRKFALAVMVLSALFSAPQAVMAQTGATQNQQESML